MKSAKHYRTCLIVVWALLVLALTSLMLSMHPPAVKYDGTFYYSILRSLFFDGDLDFHDEAARYPWITDSYGKRLPNGLISNPFAVGSALLWAPFFAAAHVYCQSILDLNCDGYSYPYILAINIGTIAWIVLGLMLLLGALRQIESPQRSKTPLFTVSAMALGSPLLFYTLVDLDYSHGNSFFAASLWFFILVRAYQSQRTTPWSSLALGLAIGLLYLVRWQDAIYGLLITPIVFRWFRLGDTVSPICFAGGAIIMASLQSVFWWILYGAPFTIPQGANFLRFSHIEGIKFLFSTWNGVFLWHPVFLICMSGLLWGIVRLSKGQDRDLRLLALSGLGVVLIEMVISAMSVDWWSGGAFGQRRLVSLVPIMALGLSLFFSRFLKPYIHLKQVFAGVVLICAMLNILTLLRYQQGLVPYNPVDPGYYPGTHTPYGHFEYERRFKDLWFGTSP